MARAKKAPSAREALLSLVTAVETAARDYGGAWTMDATLTSALNEARQIAACTRFLVRVDGGYARTYGGGWATGLPIGRATSYSENVAHAYAKELGGKVEPDLRPKKAQPKKVR